MRGAAIIVVCVLLFGYATPQHWMKADGAGKTDSVQNPDDLRKALTDCAASSTGAGRELDTMFGSKSASATFQKCMHDRGYTKS
jgi:hypothetical protein